MPHPLYHKIAGLKAKFANEADSSHTELLDVCEQVFALVEQNRADLTEAYEVQVKTDQRLHDLEKHQSTYHEPRG